MTILLHLLGVTLLMAMTSIPMADCQGGLVGPLSGMPLKTLIAFSLRFNYGITKFDQLFAKILQSSSVVDSTILPILNKGYNQLGVGECKGFDNGTGVPVFSIMSGIVTGNSDVDFGGDFLCSNECDGTCVPYQNITQAPISAYPFGCNCPSTSCDEDGPIVPPTFTIPGTFISCSPNPVCNCALQDPSNPGSDGYLCNWLNFQFGTVINLRVSYEESLSPIRWCTCCAT